MGMKINTKEESDLPFLDSIARLVSFWKDSHSLGNACIQAEWTGNYFSSHWKLFTGDKVSDQTFLFLLLFFFFFPSLFQPGFLYLLLLHDVVASPSSRIPFSFLLSSPFPLLLATFNRHLSLSLSKWQREIFAHSDRHAWLKRVYYSFCPPEGRKEGKGCVSRSTFDERGPVF